MLPWLHGSKVSVVLIVLRLAATMPCKNIGTNDKFCRKVALLRYTKGLNLDLKA